MDKRNYLLNATEEEEFSYNLSQSKEFQEIMNNCKCAIEEVGTKLRVLDYDFSLHYENNPIESIETRLKSIKSIIEKLKRRKLPLSLEAIKNNIFDIAGVRVICAFENDVYSIVKAIKKQNDIKVIRETNYIDNPKTNGYRSYHLIVIIPIFLNSGKIDCPVEIQFRTIAMDFWASLEHKLRYKKELITDLEIQKRLLNCAKVAEHLDKEMQYLKDLIALKNIQ
ncbi:MAG: GTP pyrophosphokinase family protein [Erysipelotrichaceae bacterium]|nr:GTP pyrophosphokinase family protein [Erysipelotrichaceae bacterium]